MPKHPFILHDTFAADAGRVESLIGRPKVWYCSSCATRHESTVTFACSSCGTNRPLWTCETTMVQCAQCENWNGFHRFCEWCGARSKW